MQIKGLHKGIYTLPRYANRHSPEEKDKNSRQKALEDWTKLRHEGVSEKICQQITGISRATYFRSKAALAKRQQLFQSKQPKKFRQPQWTGSDEKLVLQIRIENRTYGKTKIHWILKRDFGFTKSESTVERI
ncbi:MAG: hypothetical protein KKA19_08625 [Candidatus Margulisbacteria bacterium]|nr:hypothetical protein [Candidatus Margulisiibacteriota bacterium]